MGCNELLDLFLQPKRRPKKKKHLNLCTEVTESSIRHKLWKNMEWIKCTRMPQDKYKCQKEKVQNKILVGDSNLRPHEQQYFWHHNTNSILNQLTITPYSFGVLMKLRCLTNACDLVTATLFRQQVPMTVFDSSCGTALGVLIVWPIYHLFSH
jgi:hypothetical protein